MRRARPPAGGYKQLADLPQMIAVFPLDGALMLPRGELPLRIFEPRYLNLLDDVMAGDRMIGMIQTRGGGEPARPRLAKVGCAGRVTSFNETADGTYLITLTGVCRFAVGEELAAMTPYRQVRADYGAFAHDLSEDASDASDRDRFLKALQAYLNWRELDIDWDTAKEAPLESLVNSLAMGLPFEPAEKQALLEAGSLTARCETLTTLLEISARDDGDDTPRSIQ